MQGQVDKVIEKLEHLSPQRIAEVADFIDFLRQRDAELTLKKDFTQASEAAFAKAWDNDEDAVYDSL